MHDKIKTCMLLVAVTLTTLCWNVLAFASEGIKGLENEFKTDWTVVWNVLRPAIRILAIVIAGMGIVILLVTLFFVAKWTLNMFTGKGKFGKTELKMAAIGVIVALIITGGGWMGFIQLGESVIVKPAEQIITPGSE